MDKLTIKQEAFCQNYILTNGNGTQAAISAGYSTNTAQVIASENLTKPLIIARIAELRKPDDKVMLIQEMKERLSYLAREDNPGREGYQRQSNIMAIQELARLLGYDSGVNINIDNITLSLEYKSRDTSKQLTTTEPTPIIEGEVVDETGVTVDTIDESDNEGSDVG